MHHQGCPRELPRVDVHRPDHVLQHLHLRAVDGGRLPVPAQLRRRLPGRRPRRLRRHHLRHHVHAQRQAALSHGQGRALFRRQAGGN